MAEAEEVKKAFRQADVNGDGFISCDELKKTFRALGDWSDADFELLFSEADTNSDGKLAYEEFVDWIMKANDEELCQRAADSSPFPSRERLNAILEANPYLASEHYMLYNKWQELQTSIESGHHDAIDKLDRIIAELHTERATLMAAFSRFDFSRTDTLKPTDVQSMMRYLGFPHEDSDISELMKLIDVTGSGDVTFPEFQGYVGQFGGSLVLFEQRRKLIAEKGGFSEDDPEAARLHLKEAGIQDDAQAYWRLVVSPSEFHEVAKLEECQKRSIALIRRLARKNHDVALPNLQRRLHKLGRKDDDLWMTLAWIRELAPVIIHLNLDKMLQYMESDTHYRNQFETGTGGGTICTSTRSRWEKALFGGNYDSASPFNRCKYGVLNVMNDYRGVVKCAQYGDSYAVMKDVRLRCTFAPCDSSVCDAEKLAVLDYYAHVLNDYADGELLETIRVANSKESALLGDSEKIDGYKYKEAQYHGEVRFDSHIERLVAHPRHRSDARTAKRIQAVAAKWGWAFSWQDEEKKRMADEDQHKLGSDAWKERLERLNNEVGDIQVQEGFCKVGCGRRVCPGTTRSGNPYSTCCRGCIMGFGHDLHCGQVDESKLGEGLCNRGCGLKVSVGRDRRGRAFTTCCRGCAQGDEHSSNCQEEFEAEEGKCKFLCGRNVAPGESKSGGSFDSCCRGCARGTGHSRNCVR
eukprot:TRINITY_DN3009_c0_g1_i1.p1 TRINITY_DN3009_c0_g1~~TRINITY_DN3009_c0_g1_i1.p1  ORF type:complete len:694 (-),score=106.10 TRINITY_DN3009_c0_g1_i1:139-2220(-)